MTILLAALMLFCSLGLARAEEADTAVIVGAYSLPIDFTPGAVPDENGAHTFIFTDGVYGFSLKLDMPGKGSPKGIIVTDLFPGRG